MKQIENYKVGSDIEWFLQDKESGEIVSAEGIVQGTKYDPYHFDPNEKFFATSLDNVLAEGNIPPAITASEFYKNVEILRNYIDSNLPKNLKTVALPSARLDEKYLQTENAQIFGCDPSYNCWTNEEVHPLPTGDNLRSTGFHIHIGYENPSVDANIALGKAMDLFLGIPSVILEPKNERKAVGYGCAGNFRHQGHGFEYRSLSGYFSTSKDHVEWCFNNAQKAVEFVNDGRIIEIENLGEIIQETINNENKEKAKELIEQFKIPILEYA